MTKRLLIQENEQDIIDILCIALQIEGYETFPVLGYEADFVALIRRICPHLVMLDYKLDGRECLRTAKTIRRSYPTLPLVATSCNETIAETYRDHGFDGCIAKPFDLDCLYVLLRKLTLN